MTNVEKQLSMHLKGLVRNVRDPGLRASTPAVQPATETATSDVLHRNASIPVLLDNAAVVVHDTRARVELGGEGGSQQRVSLGSKSAHLSPHSTSVSIGADCYFFKGYHLQRRRVDSTEHVACCPFIFKRSSKIDLDQGRGKGAWSEVF